jgi:hypothetical protein
MLNRSIVFKIIVAVFGLSLTASPITFAASTSKNKGGVTPQQLAQIEALLKQVLDAVTPPTTAHNTTRLLFPFVSNTAGFDTGIVVSNAGLDSTGTVGIAGTATIFFFPNSGTAPAPFTTPNIPAGGQFVNVISALAPGFQGYIEVVCNFPFAHGFGLFSDVGARNLAATIPALVLPLERTNTVRESVGQ